MAERDSLWVTGVLDQEEVRVGEAAIWTPATSAIRARTGIRPGSGNPGLVTASGTPDANVSVSAFQAVIQSTRAAAAGAYVVTNDAAKTINILSTPAHASLARNDLIIVHQSDTFYGDADSQMRIRQVVGTPSGSPADPSLAAYPDALTLARVRVNAAASSITNGNITDLRSGFTVALGGLLPIPNQSTRDALTGIYDGLSIYRQDRDWTEIYNGSVWRVQGVALVSSVGDLSAITSPYAGQLAINTADSLTYRHTGSAWVPNGVWRASTLLTSPAASISITVPSTLRNLEIRYTARSNASAATDVMYLRINNNSVDQYLATLTQTQNTALAVGVNSGGTAQFFISNISAATAATATIFGSGTIQIQGWDAPHAGPGVTWHGQVYAANATNAILCTGGGQFTGAGPYTSVQLYPTPGNNFVAGTRVDVYGYE